MKAQSKSTPADPRNTLTLILSALLLLAALYYIGKELRYYSLTEDALGKYFPIKWWLVGHLSGGILALLIGPFQFSSRFRNRHLKIHRTLGRIYLIAIGIAAFSSTVMAWTTALATHWTWAFSLQILALVWITTALMAYRAIRKKRTRVHREWVIRSYIVTFGFVSFRWLNHTQFAESLGSFVERAPTIIWFLWAIPLLIAEIVFQWNRK